MHTSLMARLHGEMTPREQIIAALERIPPTGRVPHFELVFFPTMEAFGRVNPSYRNYQQWDQMEEAEQFAGHGGVDGFDMNSDYCFNTGPFLKHADGNIMPILDQLVQAKPHAIHSLDPQGGVDIAEVKRRVGDQICLMGNVNCGLLTTGTDDEVIESARYALRNGMPGGGYIYSTSNCVYTGMPLARYELMLDVWRKEGTYQ